MTTRRLVNIEAVLAPSQQPETASGVHRVGVRRERTVLLDAAKAASRLIAPGYWRAPPEPGQAPSVASIHPSWGTAL